MAICVWLVTIFVAYVLVLISSRVQHVDKIIVLIIICSLGLPLVFKLVRMANSQTQLLSYVFPVTLVALLVTKMLKIAQAVS